MSKGKIPLIIPHYAIIVYNTWNVCTLYSHIFRLPQFLAFFLIFCFLQSGRYSHFTYLTYMHIFMMME